MKKLIYLSTLLLITTGVFAQIHLDSFNINTAVNGSIPASSAPYSLITDGSGTLYFSASDTNYGRELYKIGSTDTQPQRLTDINTGNGNSLSVGFDNIFAFNGSVFFSASDTFFNSELWKYTPGQGASKVAEIDTANNSGSNPSKFIEFNGKLYFAARTMQLGTELYMYDPGNQSVTLVKDIGQGTFSGNPDHLTIFNGKLYFQAYDTSIGRELFELDPATNNVKLVAEIYPGKMSGSPSQLIVFNNKLYFVANDGTSGNELFEYDGSNTPARVTDINPGSGPGLSSTSSLVIFQNKLFFSGYDTASNNYQLFSYHPASSTAALAATINPSGSSFINYLTVYNGKIFFAANDGTNGFELWSYDGTNTKLEHDIIPGNGSSIVSNITFSGASLYFTARATSIGIELFRYSLYPLSVAEANTILNTTLYPNPVQDIAHLQFILEESTTLSVTITDMQGRVVYSSGNELYSEGTHNINIPLNNLASGNYLYQLNSKERLLATGKFIKQ